MATNKIKGMVYSDPMPKVTAVPQDVMVSKGKAHVDTGDPVGAVRSWNDNRPKANKKGNPGKKYDGEGY